MRYEEVFLSFSASQIRIVDQVEWAAFSKATSERWISLCPSDKRFKGRPTHGATYNFSSQVVEDCKIYSKSLPGEGHLPPLSMMNTDVPIEIVLPGSVYSLEIHRYLYKLSSR